MTILVCTNLYPPNFVGGAEIIAHYQAKGLRALGHNVIVFAGDQHADAEPYTIQKDSYQGLIVYRIRIPLDALNSQGVNFYNPEVDRRFKTLLDRHSPDVVHMHNLVGLSIGIIPIAKERRVKTVLTVHDHWGFCFKNTLIKRKGEICRDSSKCAECMRYFHTEKQESLPIRLRRDFVQFQLQEVDAFISPSHYLAQTYVRAGVVVDKFRIIPYGIDVKTLARTCKTKATGRIRFTFIGYLGEHKGLYVLLDAIKLAPAKDKIVVNIIGDGELTRQLRNNVEDDGLANQVFFWGSVDNEEITRVFEETDVLVLPSIWPENQPVTITEAFATGTAVIGSRIGGIPEIISEGYNGYLFEPGNAQDLAKAMMRFVSDPSEVQRLGRNAYASIAENTFERQVQRILRVYEEPARSSVNDYAHEFKVLCVGSKMDPRCIEALEQLSQQPRYHNWRFLMRDWLSAEQAGRADLVWVVDRSVRPEQLRDLQLNGKRLLVPFENAGLRDVCDSRNLLGRYKRVSDVREALGRLAETNHLSGGSHGLRPTAA